MLVEQWLLPVLWVERDWCAAIARVATEMAGTSGKTAAARRSSRELGRATEYIDPDRRHAIRVYELAGPGGDLGRARELAIELGWWKTRARLCAVARAVEDEGPLIVDEAEAWWDAGHPDMCALALAGLRGDDRTRRAYDLLALVGGRELDRHAAELAARAGGATGAEAGDDFVMAARFATAAGQHADAQRWLDAALATAPGHRIAATKLLASAIHEQSSEAVARYLRVVHQGLDAAGWVDATRASALALIETTHHRGYGQRMLRQALERAYDAKLAVIPGHLAMWRALLDRATAAGTRRELLPLAIRGIECSTHEVDHVWLGALATDISMREGGSAVVAGAYAEIVAEYAPEHPILRELVASVASTAAGGGKAAASAPAIAVPAAAVDAANRAHEAFEVHLDLAEVYAGAARAAAVEAPAAPPARVEEPAPVPKPLPSARAPAPARVEGPRPAPVASASPPVVAAAPAASKPAQIVPVVMTNRAPARPVAPAATASAPVLAALRTPDRPRIPPKPVDPPNAVSRARRIAIPIDVAVRVAGGRAIAAQCRDISTTGLFVLTDAALDVGAEVAVVLMLPGEEAFVEQEFTSRARVARRAPGGYGIELVGADAALLRALAAL